MADVPTMYVRHRRTAVDGFTWFEDVPASPSEILSAARALPGAKVVEQPYESWGEGKILVIPLGDEESA